MEFFNIRAASFSDDMTITRFTLIWMRFSGIRLGTALGKNNMYIDTLLYKGGYTILSTLVSQN